MTEPQPPLLAVHYSDTGIVLRTRGGAEVEMPADDALDIAAAITQAVQALHAHQQMIADINDTEGHDQ